MNDETPTLEVGFAIDTGGAFAEILRFSQMFDAKTVEIVRQVADIERATGGMMKLGGATAAITSFGGVTKRELESVQQTVLATGKTVAEATRDFRALSLEKATTERQAEALVRTLEREASTIGKTKDEIRAAKIEQLALTAAQQGNTDVADRLLASVRKLSAAQQSLAEDKFAAEMQATAAATRERERAEAAVIVQLRERSQLEAALARTNGTDRPRATDAGATYSALAAKAAEDEARAHDLSAAAIKRESDEHARLVALVRGSHDAQEADAAAAERLRAATDPLYAATKRLNAEIAESTRLYHQGATAPGEYARQQDVLAQRLRGTTAEHEAMAAAGGRNANAMRNLAIQMPDVVQGLLTGQKPFTILIQQGGQLVQVAMMAEGGLAAMAGAVGTLALALSPLVVIAGLGYVAFAKLQSSVKDSGELTRYRDSLGLTHKEMLQLSDGVDKAGDKIERLSSVTITAGDLMSGLWKTISDRASASGGGAWDGLKKGASAAFDWVLEAWQKTAAGITAGIYGTVNASKVIWSNFAGSVGDVFYQAVNLAIGAMNKLVKAGTDILNGFVHAANKIPGVNIGDFKAPQIADVKNPYAGAASNEAAAAALKAVGDGFKKEYATARKEDAAFWAQVRQNAIKHNMDRQKEEADAIKANRTPKKPKTDTHAETLAREAAATEAQIRNLYNLADAYKVSGAEALIAEARVKAESQAIKQRADIEAAVDRQIRLAIAQRVSDGEKAAASAREQAAVQERVNAMVTAGLVPAELAGDLVKGQIADLPLLDAIKAAQARADEARAQGDVSRQAEMAIAVQRATGALNDQRLARDRLSKADADSRYNSAYSSAEKRLAEMREELRLIGATDEARARSLAEFKATQEASTWKGMTADQLAAYVKLQGDLAVQGVLNTQAQSAYNDGLTLTADKWDIIASKVQSAGQGMADAFGTAGRALGDLGTIFASYQASRMRAEVEHAAMIKKAGSSEKLLAQENARYALRSSGAQIAAYGDMVGAAKDFFAEGSAGYDALAAAEKVYRVAQFAMSLQAMVQNALETAGVVTNAAAKATAEGAVGVAKQSQLVFPYNLIAMAATGAALVAAGISVLGGGGSSHVVDPGNTGTGTVLGDSSAKSDSIKNALDALKDVDTLTNTYAREMSASLKSIDNQIGGVAAQIVKGGADATGASVAQGFKPNAIGSVLGAIPLIGGFLSSLFGSKTEVTASGLYGGSQSLGSVLNGGYNAQTYSDVTKTSKFLGITTGHSYSTQYGALDSGLQNQFTLILKSFDDAIVKAAGPLGAATTEIQDRLNGFVVNLGKIDLKGLSGTEIQAKLTAVFGAAADSMADAAFPGIARFQKVGEGAFETLVRVASTVEAVTNALSLLGGATASLGMDAKIGLADQFDSVSDLTSATDAYFQAFYTSAEQTAAKTAQFAKVFDSLGLSMPASLAAFRQLVEAQDLATDAGRATYATLLQLAPAFSDLQTSMEGVKSAADVLSEKQDLQRQLLELQGNTAAIRALDLAKVDASNRELQQQVWAIQDAQDAAKAAKDLSDAWTSVGDSITTEINRIRGLSSTGGSSDFATLMGQFNAATSAARGGDMDAAKTLPGLSQSLLSAAALVASSRQELARVQAQTASSLEATNAALGGRMTSSAADNASILAAAATTSQANAAPAASNDDMASEIKALREEMAAMRSDNNAGHAATASNTGRIARKLDDVTSESGGNAISVANAA